MGMKTTPVTDARSLMAFSLGSLADGTVIETREQDGGWRLYLHCPEGHDAPTRLDWRVLATSRDTAPQGSYNDRRITVEVVVAAVLDAKAVTVLHPDDDDGNESRRRAIRAAVDKWQDRETVPTLPNSTLAALVDAVEAAL